MRTNGARTSPLVALPLFAAAPIAAAPGPQLQGAPRVLQTHLALVEAALGHQGIEDRLSQMDVSCGRKPGRVRLVRELGLPRPEAIVRRSDCSESSSSRRVFFRLRGLEPCADCYGRRSYGQYLPNLMAENDLLANSRRRLVVRDSRQHHWPPGELNFVCLDHLSLGVYAVV